MKKKDIIPYLDHTNLSPVATEADIYEFAKNAVGTGVASLCIQPCYISFINREFANLFKLCTVVGFPNGYDAPEIKVKAVEKALEDGANEIDYVVHLGKIKIELLVPCKKMSRWLCLCCQTMQYLKLF